VILTTGEKVAARVVVSNADPRRTLGLVDPAHLAPEFIRRVQNFRTRTTLAKVNYGVSSLPRFACLEGMNDQNQRSRLTGCMRLCISMTAMERAFDAVKYGEMASEPWIELAIPSISDRTLAPEGQHVVSAYVQGMPSSLRGRSWDTERERLGDLATRTIARFAPTFPSSIVAREILTPLDLERTYGLTGGHIFHGELALDQLFLARPFLGYARYRTPIRNLFLCGTGTHPGTGLDGRSGALAARVVIKAMRDGARGAR
jgi:phytoene dehydrogenase-like protein